VPLKKANLEAAILHKGYEAIIELFYTNYIRFVDVWAKSRLQVCKIYEKG